MELSEIRARTGSRVSLLESELEAHKARVRLLGEEPYYYHYHGGRYWPSREHRDYYPHQHHYHGSRSHHYYPLGSYHYSSLPYHIPPLTRTSR